MVLEFFDAISLSLSGVISAFTSALLWFNPLALIAVFALLAYYIQRKASLTLFVTLSFLLIFNLGYWQETMETLAQVTFATLVCVVIGVPLGIVAAHRPWFYAALRPVLDLMQTVPTFVYLIPTLTLFGLGGSPRPDFHGGVRDCRAHPPDLPGHPRRTGRTDGRWQSLRLLPSPAPVAH
nr:hypothetical protein GCM10020185_64310 [Pseudomonas brassicacearum subsp. brassicacearum]